MTSRSVSGSRSPSLWSAVPGAFAQIAASATDVYRLPPEFPGRLLTAWSAVKDPLIIVLDDIHHLQSPQITEGLGFVVEHLPARSRMLLTSRVDPRLPVSRWRGRGWLAELRQPDLALTLAETAELFAALGEHRLTTSEVGRLWRRTEGWVAGLRLAAAGLRDRADVSAAVAEFSGRTPMVADLLADELLHRAPKELSEFLLQTSVADVLDAELCDALSGRSDSGDVLRRMEADLQFVMATGPSRDTYRYHPLLAEMLRSELQAHRPEEVQGLNRLAAAMLEARGDIAGAVRCLLAAGDTDRAFSIVFEAAWRRSDRSDRPGIAAFVNLFPRELVTESASRMLTYAVMLGFYGQVAEAHAWVQRAEMRIGDEPEARAEDVATLDVLRLLTFAVTAGAADEIDAGRRAVEAGLDLGVAGARVYQVLLRLEKARAAAAVDDFDGVFATLREAGLLSEHLPRSPLRRMVDAAAARWHLEAGETYQAEELIATLADGSLARTLLGARHDLACGRFDAVKARLPRASLATMRDQLTGELLLARAAIESGGDAAAHVIVAVGLAAPERLVRVFLEEGAAVTRLARAAAGSLGTESGASLSVALGSPPRSRGAPPQPAAILTERELLVLRFLPSRLTNAEIARECLMSVNTVKTHLKRIYAKLGVSSRAETGQLAPAQADTGPRQPINLAEHRIRRKQVLGGLTHEYQVAA